MNKRRKSRIEIFKIGMEIIILVTLAIFIILWVVVMVRLSQVPLFS